MGLIAKIDDWWYERRERKKREFIAKMEEQAERHRLFQEGRSAALKLWEANMRKKREQDERSDRTTA